MNAKPVVFISHIDDEKEIASAFKSLIESSFLGLINVFVSSDARSIELGDRWLNTMTDALKTCAIEFIICSPISVMRPWINFEAGAGWVRDIPVVPLCHSGIQPANLPLPLNLLQGANLNEVSSLRHIFTLLSSVLSSNVPPAEFADFIAKVKDFEVRYTFWNFVNREFAFLKSYFGELFQALLAEKLNVDLTESEIILVRQQCAFLLNGGIIGMEQTGGSMQTPEGVFYGYTISLTEVGNTVVKDPKFQS